MGATGRRRLGGLALALGGLLGLAFTTIYYLFTHGSTQEDRHDTFMSLDGATLCRLEVVRPSLMVAGLVLAFQPVAGNLGRRGRVGLITACGALAAQIVALILQCWVVHPDRDFESLPSYLGFVLGATAYVPLTAGLILLGLVARRARIPAPAPGLPLLVGILVFPTVLLSSFSQDALSTGGRGWELALTAIHVPLALAWMLLGMAVWAEAWRASR